MQKLMNIIKKLINRSTTPSFSGENAAGKGKVKLVAIAKDEAFYFPEWIHHHLFFGFDEIDIFINRTSDNSSDVLNKICESYPQVKWHSADWIDKCPGEAKSQIQFIVYNKIWDELLKAGGYSHIFFLDIDEFWIPQNFDVSIHDFIDNYSPDDVISFEWLNDLGNLPAFCALPQVLEGNLSPLVKTLYPVNTKIKELRHHVALFDGNPHHILVDGNEFAHRKSLIQAVREDLQSLKDAFIYHRAHRSIEEYISLLYRGRPGDEFPYKTNRHGLPTPDPHYNKVVIDEKQYAKYKASFSAFNSGTQVSSVSQKAKGFVLARLEQSLNQLQQYVSSDYITMMQMFRGVYHHHVVAEFSKQRAKMIRQNPDNFRLMRDLAIDASSQDIHEAIRIMEMAYALNPDGPVIKQKLSEFKHRAASGK
ncbi:glycosyltransferase family 2 protein [Alteromonas sp. 1_MG-2023]|uniref:glycosyltransferase family 2 protein n=1 Tax=Alteromonas sp. 1_MG-2023 TaxID=3062669 RepID=UPI0026E3E841|nr:glycosyltransferase family 2 protein [Alteromonas sp. 1_MG-2023]MDO6477522.1 glycosyltransferase family 2 protein [Alteromonas sp. 1_MG-2023]